MLQISLIIYPLGVLVTLGIEVRTILLGNPDAQRGGGVPASVIVSLLWPVLAVMLTIGFVLYAVDWLSE